MTQTLSADAGTITLDQIGRYHDGSSAYFYDGLIDEVKIYNRALSAPELLKNYKHGKGKHKN